MFLLVAAYSSSKSYGQILPGEILSGDVGSELADSLKKKITEEAKKICVNLDKISAELRDAANIPPLQTKSSMSPEERAVLTWLRVHQVEIALAEKKWDIDRRAIAGAIAWEALHNVKDPPGLFNRWSGPGKPHYWDLPYTNPVTQQVEDSGYLPKVSPKERKNILSKPEGAINYIGAIMRAQADALSDAGYDISRNPTLLTFYYHSRDLEQVQQRAQELNRLGSPPMSEVLSDISGSDMAKWLKDHVGYLEEAVGKPDGSLLKDYASSPKANCLTPQGKQKSK